MGAGIMPGASGSGEEQSGRQLVWSCTGAAKGRPSLEEDAVVVTPSFESPALLPSACAANGQKTAEPVKKATRTALFVDINVGDPLLFVKFRCSP